MSIDIEEFKSYLAIDKYQLDECLMEQPSLFYEVSEALRIALSVRDEIESELKNLHAELYYIYREQLEKDAQKEAKKQKRDKPKQITEGMVNNSILLDEDYIELRKKLVKANNKASQLSTLKDAFHQRSYMLREMAKLFVANYYERDAVTGRSKEEKDTIYEKQKSRMAEKRDEKAKRKHRKKTRL